MDTENYSNQQGQAQDAAASQATTAQGWQTEQTAQRTAQRPPIPGQQPAGGAHAAAPAPGDPEQPRKKGGFKSGIKPVLLGLLGGVVGAGALTGVLLGTGVIGPTHTTVANGGQNITIDPSSDDTTLATAVAAKAVTSVASVYSTTSTSEGSGSGVILDTDGDILTNYHVIEGAESLSVTINGKSYTAEYVGSDSSSDLAVIKADLNGDTVTPMEVGDSDELQVGDWVMTIGSPFGLEQSVSQGIVSALTRSSILENSAGNAIYANLIQTDAAINPGNSGGALVNSKGQLVGIASLYSSSTESSASVGFAIPGNYAVNIANQILNNGQVLHAYIGLSMQTVNAQSALTKRLGVSQGAYVADVTEGGPASTAGIQKGDVIVGIDDTQISSADGVILAVRSHNIGDTVKVTVMRGSDEKTFDVTLGSDEALQSSQDTTVNDNGTVNGNGNSNGNGGSGTDSDTFVQQFQQWLEQQQQNNGYGNRGYGFGN